MCHLKILLFFSLSICLILSPLLVELKGNNDYWINNNEKDTKINTVSAIEILPIQFASGEAKTIETLH